MARARMRYGRIAALLGIAFAAVVVGRAWASPAPTGDASGGGGFREERFTLETAAALDTLAQRAAGDAGALRRLWTRGELATLCERIREELAAGGALSAVLRMTLFPAEGTGAGTALLTLDAEETADPSGNPGQARRGLSVRPLRMTVTGAEGIISDPERGLAPGADGSPIGRIADELTALRASARERGHYGAEARLDSIVPRDGTVVAFVRLLPGPPVHVEAFELTGATATKPMAAAAVAGLKPGRLVTPRALEEARDRLLSSELFAAVGEIAVQPGRDPSLARVVVPVEEARSSRFEGALGLASEGGLTGLVDLALGNLGGSGRSAGARWAGSGAGRSDYAIRYREPALLGRSLDASLALDARVYDSLFTQTRWSLRVGSRPARRVTAMIGVERSGAVYTGPAHGSSGSWALEGSGAYSGLLPRENPLRGFAISATTQVGRRFEETPGAPDIKRGLFRGTFGVEAARPVGARRALFAAVRAERVALGAGSFPAEELRYVGGNEGLRGHPDRAFGGNRLLVATVEHRWLADETGGRTYLFFDAARHNLDGTLQAGAADPAVGPLARTVLSNGWDFGYGAGLRTRAAAGTVGIELGMRPGAAVREAQLHIHYASTW